MIKYTATTSQIDSGSLDRQIEWFAPVQTQTSSGFAKVTYVSQGLDVAMKQYGGSTEPNVVQQEVGMNQVVWYVRYHYEIRAGWYLVCDGQRYDVEGAPQEIGRKMHLRVTTKMVE